MKCDKCGYEWGVIPIYELDGKPAIDIKITCGKCGYVKKVEINANSYEQ